MFLSFALYSELQFCNLQWVFVVVPLGNNSNGFSFNRASWIFRCIRFYVFCPSQIYISKDLNGKTEPYPSTDMSSPPFLRRVLMIASKTCNQPFGAHWTVMSASKT